MDTESVLALLKDVAARVITPRFRSLAAGQIIEKNPGDLVTVADREAEVLITEWLNQHDPSALVVGEEATETDPGLLTRLESAPRAWVVDPVDGTKNFVHGRKEHAVMVAEIVDGEAVRGWIWQPEFERAYVAEKGAGLYLNGERLVRSERPDGELKVLTSRPSEEGSVGGLTVGPSAWCCGVDYPWIADGTVDAVLYVSNKPWDHAPGSLFVREMGGVVRYADGTEYLPGRRHRDRLVPAANEDVWQTVVKEASRLLR